MRTVGWKIVLCMGAVLLIGGLCWAQQEPVEEVEGVGEAQELEQRDEIAEYGDTETRQIEEITVTARKTKESLDDTPLTIRAITADAVAELGLFNVEDVALNTPGIHISNYFGSRDDPNISFRGMDGGTVDRLAQISSTYIDGIFLPGAALWISVGAIERTEVVKGPQSALFGRSAFGGAINFVWKDPTRDWAGNVNLTLGENGRTDLGLGVGGPISDSVAFHAFARTYDYDGGYDNPYPDSEDLGGQGTDAFEGSLLWDISDSVGVKVRGIYSSDEDGPAAFAWFDQSIHNCGPFDGGTVSYYCGELTPDLITDFGYDTKTEDVPGSSWPMDRFGLDRNFALGALHVDAMLSDSLSLTAVTGWVNEELEYMQDFSGTGTLIQYSHTEDTLLSQEVRLQGNTSKFDWLVGGYYLDAEYESYGNGFGCADSSFTFAPVPFPGSGCVLFAGAPVRGAFNVTVPSTPVRAVENLAVFGSLTWRASDNLSLGVDARAARETLDFGSLTAVDGQVRDLKDDFNSFLPRFLVDWKPNDYSTVYANVAQGNRAGNFNPEVAEMCASCIDAFESEYGIGVAVPESEAWNYEAGYKVVTRNGRHRFNAAVFYFDWSNQAFTQQAFGFDTNGDGVVDENDNLAVDYQTVAGKSEIKGAEFFYTGWLGRHVNLMATYNYNDAKYKVFEDTTVGRVFGDPDASGKEMPRSPKSSATLGLGFVFPAFGSWEFNARADYIYRGSSYTWAVNLAETGDTNRLNLRAGLRNDRWDVSVWMDNATDDDTLMAIRRFTALEDFTTPTWWAGLPGVKEAGVTLRYIF